MRALDFVLLFATSAIAAALPLAESSALSNAVVAANGTFTWDKKTFFIDGKSFQLIGGQIDPQRVPRQYWSQRLQMAKSMGLNTILSYLYWQDIERHPGQFNFNDRNDIAGWFQEVEKAGLKAVLRPGPYVCAERDWGGMPGWLTQVSGMKHRSNNQPFLDATDKYMSKVASQIQRYLITNGGPILMVQIENEYGWAGSDHTYTGNLAGILKKNFPNMKLYTNDAANAGALKNGQVPGALAVFDGTDNRNGVNVLRSAITDQSSVGPVMNGEYWIRWFDNWGSRNRHNTYDGDTNGMQGRANDLDWMLSNSYHFSVFMFHGGTSFEFGSGSGDTTPRTPFTTSYDYGAALDETGRPSQIYNYFRSAIAKHVSNIPAIPSTPSLASVADFALTPVLGMFDNLPTNPKTSSSPLVMEATGQVFGYILYEAIATGTSSGRLQPGNGAARDRVIVYVNGQKKGVIDSIYKTPATVNVNLSKGDKLWLLVENLGRADNGFSDQNKGISGDVTVGGTKITGWNHYNFPLDTAPTVATTGGPSKNVPANGPPVWYRGTFKTSNSGMAADTFLQLPGGIKGVVFVNGYNLGRYWTIGPQQELFVPGAYLKQGEDNIVSVLELEPSTTARAARGVAKRTWKNNADPDCNNCT